jgi:hypothetical protein
MWQASGDTSRTPKTSASVARAGTANQAKHPMSPVRSRSRFGRAPVAPGSAYAAKILS